MCTGSEGLATGDAGFGGLLSKGASALTMLGGTMNAAGAMTTGRQQSDFYDYKARQAEADANAEEQLGEVRAGKVRKAGKVAMGQTRAAQGASGVDVNAGSTLDVQENLQAGIESDALTELLTGKRRAASLRGTAAGYRAAGSNAMADANAAAARSLLTSAANTAKGLSATNRYKSTDEAKAPQYVTPGDWFGED